MTDRGENPQREHGRWNAVESQSRLPARGVASAHSLEAIGEELDASDNFSVPKNVRPESARVDHAGSSVAHSRWHSDFDLRDDYQGLSVAEAPDDPEHEGSDGRGPAARKISSISKEIAEHLKKTVPRETLQTFRKGVSFTTGVVGGAARLPEIKGLSHAPKVSRAALDLSDAVLRAKERDDSLRHSMTNSAADGWDVFGRSSSTATPMGSMRFNNRQKWTPTANSMSGFPSEKPMMHTALTNSEVLPGQAAAPTTWSRLVDDRKILPSPLVRTPSSSSSSSDDQSPTTIGPLLRRISRERDTDSQQQHHVSSKSLIMHRPLPGAAAPMSVLGVEAPPPEVTTSAPSHLPSLSLVTFNAGLLTYRVCGVAWYQNPPFTKRRLHQIPSSLSEVNADIVAMQEVYDESHADYIIESLRIVYPFAGRRTSGGCMALHNGLLVLSKFPILHTRFHPFSEVTPLEKIFGSKGMLEVSLEIPMVGAVTMINVHLASGAVDPESRAVEQVRNGEIKQVLEVANAAAARGEAPVIIGDLNAGPNLCASNYRLLLRDGFRDAYVAARSGASSADAFSQLKYAGISLSKQQKNRMYSASRWNKHRKRLFRLLLRGNRYYKRGYGRLRDGLPNVEMGSLGGGDRRSTLRTWNSADSPLSLQSTSLILCDDSKSSNDLLKDDPSDLRRSWCVDVPRDSSRFPAEQERSSLNRPGQGAHVAGISFQRSGSGSVPVVLELQQSQRRSSASGSRGEAELENAAAASQDNNAGAHHHSDGDSSHGPGAKGCGDASLITSVMSTEKSGTTEKKGRTGKSEKTTRNSATKGSSSLENRNNSLGQSPIEVSRLFGSRHQRKSRPVKKAEGRSDPAVLPKTKISLSLGHGLRKRPKQLGRTYGLSQAWVYRLRSAPRRSTRKAVKKGGFQTFVEESATNPNTSTNLNSLSSIVASRKISGVAAGTPNPPCVERNFSQQEKKRSFDFSVKDLQYYPRDSDDDDDDDDEGSVFTDVSSLESDEHGGKDAQLVGREGSARELALGSRLRRKLRRHRLRSQDFTWDPKNPLNIIGPHAVCHGLRCDHIFLPPSSAGFGLDAFTPSHGEVVFTEPIVTVEGCCFGLFGQALLVTLSDHYGVMVQLSHKSISQSVEVRSK